MQRRRTTKTTDSAPFEASLFCGWIENGVEVEEPHEPEAVTSIEGVETDGFDFSADTVRVEDGPFREGGWPVTR